MKLSLGVVDMPYGYGDDPEATTGEVAQALEDNYGIFSLFYQAHHEEIIGEVTDAVSLQLENFIRYGAPLDVSAPLLLGETIRTFNIFLEMEEMAGLSVNVGPGLHNTVPTMAAIDGRNSRLKQKHGERRPSFIDGGLFKSSFTAWIDNDADT